MSTDKIYKVIESSGSKGVTRAQIRKEFGAEVDEVIKKLLSQGVVFTDKNGRSITYWSKDNYMQHLLSTDPKFRLIFDIYAKTSSTISDSITKINNDLNKKVANITSDLNSKVSTLASEVKTKSVDISQSQVTDNGNGNHNGNKPTLDQFKMEFDRTLTEIPTSIGWVELALIRERICDKYSISKQNFYSLASQLIDQFSNRYELSSGGNEGVLVRGLVHGFVRCI
jgi:gas vesicle protein